jgi:hypothetical protein
VSRARPLRGRPWRRGPDGSSADGYVRPPTPSRGDDDRDEPGGKDDCRPHGEKREEPHTLLFNQTSGRGSHHERAASAIRSSRPHGLRAEIPEKSVVADAFGVRIRAVGVEEVLLPARAVVPDRAQGGDGQIGPAVGNTQGAEIDVSGPATVVADQRVRRARVAVADSELRSGGGSTSSARASSIVRPWWSSWRAAGSSKPAAARRRASSCRCRADQENGRRNFYAGAWGPGGHSMTP